MGLYEKSKDPVTWERPEFARLPKNLVALYITERGCPTYFQTPREEGMAWGKRVLLGVIGTEPEDTDGWCERVFALNVARRVGAKGALQEAVAIYKIHRFLKKDGLVAYDLHSMRVAVGVIGVEDGSQVLFKRALVDLPLNELAELTLAIPPHGYWDQIYHCQNATLIRQNRDVIIDNLRRVGLVPEDSARSAKREQVACPARAVERRRATARCVRAAARSASPPRCSRSPRCLPAGFPAVAPGQPACPARWCRNLHSRDEVRPGRLVAPSRICAGGMPASNINRISSRYVAPGQHAGDPLPSLPTNIGTPGIEQFLHRGQPARRGVSARLSSVPSARAPASASPPPRVNTAARARPASPRVPSPSVDTSAARPRSSRSNTTSVGDIGTFAATTAAICSSLMPLTCTACTSASTPQVTASTACSAESMCATTFNPRACAASTTARSSASS